MKLATFIRIGRLEAMSYLVLVIIAMPLKYFFDFPEAVKYVGWLHGFLFVLYSVALLVIGWQRSWPIWKMGVLFLAAFIPVGPLLTEKWLKRWAGEFKHSEK